MSKYSRKKVDMSLEVAAQLLNDLINEMKLAGIEIMEQQTTERQTAKGIVPEMFVLAWPDFYRKDGDITAK